MTHPKCYVGSRVRGRCYEIKSVAKNIWRNIWGLAAVPDIVQGDNVVPASLGELDPARVPEVMSRPSASLSGCLASRRRCRPTTMGVMLAFFGSKMARS